MMKIFPEARVVVNGFTAVLAGAITISMSNVSSAETLRFGTEAAYPPYEYKLPNGNLAGLDIDIGNALCAVANVKCQWVEMSFDGLIAGLHARKFDAIDSALAPTDARRAVMDFTQPVYSDDIRLVAARGSHLLPNPTSLAGKRVGVLQGSVQATYAKSHWEPHGVTVHEYQDQDGVYADLVNGRLDATVVIGAAARSAFLAKPQGAGFELAGPRIEDPSILGSSSVLGVRKGDSHTLKMLDAALAKLKSDGTIARLERQYLGDAK